MSYDTTNYEPLRRLFWKAKGLGFQWPWTLEIHRLDGTLATRFTVRKEVFFDIFMGLIEKDLVIGEEIILRVRDVTGREVSSDPKIYRKQ